MQGQPVDILMRKLNRMSDIRVSGGPFHYQMRAGIYAQTFWFDYIIAFANSNIPALVFNFLVTL